MASDDNNSTETPENDTPETEAGHERATKSSNSGSKLTLVIALTALGIAAYGFWQSSQAPVDNGQAMLKGQLAELSRAIEKLEGKASYNAENLQQLTARIDTQGGRIDALPVRIEQLEQALAAVPGTDQQTRQRLLKQEAEWYLRLADSQLSIARNVTATQAALTLADERLAELADPRYTPVRDRIAAAIGELQIRQEHPVALELASLQELIDILPGLPLRSDVPESYGGPEYEPASEDGTDRALAAIKEAFSGVISVKRSNEEIVPQLSDADAALLKRSMLLSLQTTKLALIQGDADTFTHSLDVVDAKLRTWFDGENTNVIDAIASIAALRETGAARPLPDIGAIRKDYALVLTAPELAQ